MQECSDGSEIERLLEIMRALRDSTGGCSWDLAQTFSSVAPYTIEEAYEVAHAIDSGSRSALRDELGDLLFQVVFHAQMADEEGAFCFSDVVASICDKMERRHPHVFSGHVYATAAEQSRAWEEIKRSERGDDSRSGSLMDGVGLGLPELRRAVKVQKRAAGAGFDWTSVEGVLDKVSEELEELKQAITEDDQAQIEQEFGDLLFSCANLSRHLGVDAGASLRRATSKFEARFRQLERLLFQSGSSFDESTPQLLEQLWERVKTEST